MDQGVEKYGEAEVERICEKKMWKRIVWWRVSLSVALICTVVFGRLELNVAKWVVLSIDEELNLSGMRRHSICLNATVGNPPFPYCDMNLDLESRVEDLISRLSLSEKAGLLGNAANDVKRLHIDSYQFWSEALHGVANAPGVSFDGPIKSATSFPQVITTAASFNATLFRLIGSAISTEARVFANHNQAGLHYFTPNINIFRDPRWGRGHETPGEDPKLNGDYAEHFVQGFQNGEEDRGRLKASACCKHFAAYNLELWHDYDRLKFNAIVSSRDMHETYLPAFEACVTRGKVTSLMCSYNAINGVPSCANRELLESYAREKWGFDGYITGDCGAVDFVHDRYNYLRHSIDETVGDVLSATVDIACDEFLKLNSEHAVRNKVVKEELLDRALKNLFKVQIRLGMFDPASDQPYLDFGEDKVNSPESQQLALEAAQQGIVLLKNFDDTVPLKRNRTRKIALIGPHGNATELLLGNYFGIPPFIVSLLEGIKNVQENTVFEPGCDLTSSTSPDHLMKSAEKAAVEADQTILAVGISSLLEREGGDRETLTLPGRQAELIKRVVEAAKRGGKPRVIVVLVAGGMIDVSDLLTSDHVGAVFWCGYPGMYGGRAAADILFGKVNPSGRLTQTFYPAEFVNQVSMIDMDMHPNPATKYPGRTYRFYTGSVVLPFGFGLSYSHFTLSVSNVDIRNDLEENVTIFVNVFNSGKRQGSTVVLAFLSPPEESKISGMNGHLNKKLVGYFRTTELSAGNMFAGVISFSKKSEAVVYTFPEQREGTPIKFDREGQNISANWELSLETGEDAFSVLI